MSTAKAPAAPSGRICEKLRPYVLNDTPIKKSQRRSILRDNHNPNRSVRDDLRICYFDITIS